MREAVLSGRVHAAADRWTAGGAAALAAVGAAVLMQGAGSRSIPVTIVGAGMISAGLLLILVGGWMGGSALVLLSLPLPAAYSSDDARIAPALLVTALVLAGWFLRAGVEGRRVGGVPLPWRAMVALLGAATISAMFARETLSALRELLNLGLLLSLLVLLANELRYDARVRRALPAWMAVLGLCGGVAALLQTAGVVPTRFPMAGTTLYRATLGFGWPNEAGMFFAIVLPFTVHLARARGDRWGSLLGLAGSAGCLLGLLCTYSRGSWLAVMAAPAVLLLVGERRAPLRFWLAAGAAAVVLNLLVGGVIYARFASLVGDWIVEQRAALMLAGLLMFRAHPFVGVGPGGFGGSLEEFGPQIPWLVDYTGSAHNAFIHAAAEMGAFGLIAFTAFLGSCFVALLRTAREGRRLPIPAEARSLRDTAVWAFATACLVSLVEWPLAHGVGQLIVLVAALGSAMRSAPSEQERPVSVGHVASRSAA